MSERQPSRRIPPSETPESEIPTEENASLTAEGRRKLLRAVIIETTHLTEAQARDIADHRMAESKEDRSAGWIKRTVTRIWKHNLFQEYYRQREVIAARKQIKETGNLYAGEEGIAPEQHQAAMGAIIDRFTSEYETDTLRDEERASKQVVESGEANERIKALIRDYAGNPSMSRAAFDEERGRILATLDTKERKSNATYADNFFELATQARNAVEHGAKLDEIDFDVSLTLGTARESLNTEAKMNSFDRGLEKMKSTRLGGLVTNETVVTLAAGAYAFVKAAGIGALKSNLSRWGTFGAGVAVAGALAGYNESLRIRRERAQHMRERAKGMTFEESADRRAEMDKNAYGSRSAREISAALESRLDKARSGELSEAERVAILADLADLEARISLGDERKADLIAYSRFDQVEQERLSLMLARARMKATLSANDREAFNAQLADLTQKSREELIGGEEGLDNKDRVFAKMHRKKIAGAIIRTALIGGTMGLAAQEIGAAFDGGRDGVIEGAWKTLSGNRAELDHEATALEGLRRLLPGSSPRMPFEDPHTVMLGNTAIELPKGADLVANPDGTYNLLRGGEVIADKLDLKLDAQGNLTEASRALLGGNDVAATYALTEGRTVSSAEYVNEHKDLTHQVRRGLWYDNNTPKPVFDHNELRQWWGGKNNTGVDAKGNFVFSVDRMTSGGSFHGDQSIDAAGQTKAGGLKMLFSLNRDTQHQVFEVSIDKDGNAIIPRDSEIAKLMFREEGGRAVFMGQYAEVAQSVGTAGDGAEQVRILSTVVGEGRDSIDMPPVAHVRLDPSAGSDVIAPPFLPFAWARRPLERGLYGPMTPRGAPVLPAAYYGGGPAAKEQLEAYREQLSPALRENPDASLDPSKEIEGYLGRQESRYLQQAQALAYSVEPMKPSCELSIAIPIAGHQEEANIERTLSSYLNQTADPETFELVLFVNQPATDNEGRAVAPDGTMARILDFKKKHPELNIRVMHAVLPLEEAKIGRLRKLLTDANLVRMSARGGSKDTIIVSNDADTKGVAPEYVKNFVDKLDKESSTDALMGQLDWDPEAYIRNPLVHIGTRLFQYINISNRWNGAASSGSNFAFRASTYAAVGGYDLNSSIGEDVDLGRRIRAARANAKSHTPIAYAGARVSRLYTSARRAEHAVKEGTSPVEQWNNGFSAFDDEVRKTRWEDTGTLPDYDSPVFVAQLVTQLEIVINRTITAMGGWQGNKEFDKNIRRSLSWLGLKFVQAGPNSLRITDASRLIEGLKNYQKEGMNIMARKTGSLEARKPETRKPAARKAAPARKRQPKSAARKAGA